MHPINVDIPEQKAIRTWTKPHNLNKQDRQIKVKYEKDKDMLTFTGMVGKDENYVQLKGTVSQVNLNIGGGSPGSFVFNSKDIGHLVQVFCIQGTAAARQLRQLKNKKNISLVALRIYTYVQGLVDIAVQPNTLINPAEPCCQIVSKAVDPVIQQEINSIANALATSTIAAEVETIAPCCEAKALTGAISQTLDQLAIRTALKGGNAAQTVDSILAAIQKDPNAVVGKIIANLAKQNAQLNYSIDLGAGQIVVNGANPQQAFGYLDSASISPCCQSQQTAGFVAAGK